MGTQKNSSKVTAKAVKKTSGASFEMTKKSSLSGAKAGQSTKKTANSIKVKGNIDVSSHQEKKSSLNHGKTSAKTKGIIAAALSKKSGALPKVEGSFGDTVCREVACEGLATSGGYCRLHYIKNWKKIKRKEVILKEKKLNQYIEELVVKYPDKYIEAIRQDLANDKDFAKVIYDLDLDEGVDDFDVEGGDSVDSLIDTIKRDFEDEGDAF